MLMCVMSILSVHFLLNACGLGNKGHLFCILMSYLFIRIVLFTLKFKANIVERILFFQIGAIRIVTINVEKFYLMEYHSN